MAKKSKSTYIIGCAVIAISVLLIAFLAVIISGITSARQNIVLSSGSLEKIYDGTPLVYEDWKIVSGKLEKGHEIVPVFSGGRTDAGSSQNYFTVKILDKNNNDVTEKYNVEYQPGELRVIARNIVVTTGDAIKEYDATPLSIEEYDVGEGLILGHTLVAEVFGERTDAGISDNIFSVVITDDEENDITNNYNIEKHYGKLEVVKRSIKIRTPHYHKVYDGEPLVREEWDYASEAEVLEGHEITVVVNGSQTDAGKSYNTVSEVKITKDGINVTHNYDITYDLGELWVETRRITLRSESDAKEYDGTPLKNGAWKVSSVTTFVEGHIPIVTIDGERTEPGENLNTFAEVRIEYMGRDVTFNYEISLHEGDLVVTNPFAVPPPLDDNPIDFDDQESANRLMVRVLSDESGLIYLRYASYGNYTGNGWMQAQDYQWLIDDKYSMNYLTGLALSSAGYTSNRVWIESFCGNYLLPYYLDTDVKNYEIQTSDVKNSGDTSQEYSAYYYLFNYVDDGLKNYDLGSLKNFEDEYYSYVKGSYLSVPTSTLQYFREVINTQGFDANSPDIIGVVASYIQKAAVYNIDYDRDLDREPDVGVSFLKTYKEGICQHFAMSATLLFRALGIPARYTTGYTGETVAGEEVEIYGRQAHAWVEVYLSGIGWVYVEVTGTGPAFDGGGDVDGDGDNGNGSQGNDLKIKPVDLFKKYENGVVLEAGNEIQGINALTNQGYTYEAQIIGKQTVVGIGYSEIKSFVLYDPDGNDVTDEFNITFAKGKLHLYMWELSVVTESLEKMYDGTPLYSGSAGYEIIGRLSGNHHFDIFALVGRQTYVGWSENACNIKIVDNNGADVTYMYFINKDYGTLTVVAREITVTAGTASKPFDGTALVCEEYKISWSGGGDCLAENDKVSEIYFSGSQTVPGRSYNEIESIVITDENGTDVTKNYSITFISGELTVSA